MPEYTLQDVEISPEGTIIEVIRIVSPKDPFSGPACACVSG